MPRSESQKRARQTYEEKTYDQILIKVKKGKREEYRQAAEDLGIGLMELFRQGADRLIADADNNQIVFVKPAPIERQPTAEKLTSTEKNLLDEFNRLSVDAQKALLKFLKTLNEQ